MTGAGAAQATVRPERILAEFVEDDIEIATGTISGREALVQIIVLPMTLAAGMVIIGLIFAAGL